MLEVPPLGLEEGERERFGLSKKLKMWVYQTEFGWVSKVSMMYVDTSAIKLCR